MRDGPPLRPELEGDLSRILDVVGRGKHHAVYLVGSYGRGEGATRRDGERWRAVNDYDVLVVTEEPTAPPVEKRRLQVLAGELGVDAIDVGVVHRRTLPSLPRTLAVYDWMHGSRLLDGADVRGELAPMSPRDIPPYEVVKLVCNRAAGLLLAARSPLGEFARNQCVKAWIAVGDAFLLARGRYDPSYRQRRELFRDAWEMGLVPLGENDAATILAAYGERLPEADGRMEFAASPALIHAMAHAYLRAAEDACGVRPRGVRGAFDSLVRRYAPLAPLREPLQHLPGRPRRGGAAREIVLFAQPVSLCDPTALRGLRFATKLWRVPGALTTRWDAQGASSLWEAWCH